MAYAADICTETVPTTRFIDGIPAYAQCAASMTTAVYSNNGVDTSTTSGGTGWVRTQGSGGYQCTELAHRYLYFKWNVTSVPNGNAGVWCDGSIPNGLAKATVPVHGDLIVFAPGSCGADATTGHVGVIDVVNADATVSVVQQNVASRSKYKLTCAACFLHVVANDGAGSDGGVAPGDAGTPSDGGTGGTTGGAGRTGTAGTFGAAGTTGTAGTFGTAGTTGASGTTGTTGASGSTGTAGDRAGAAGTGGAAGGTGGAPSEADGGVACAITAARSPASHGGAIVMALVALLVLGGRPRRHRRRP